VVVLLTVTAWDAIAEGAMDYHGCARKPLQLYCSFHHSGGCRNSVVLNLGPKPPLAVQLRSSRSVAAYI